MVPDENKLCCSPNSLSYGIEYFNFNGVPWLKPRFGIDFITETGIKILQLSFARIFEERLCICIRDMETSFHLG